MAVMAAMLATVIGVGAPGVALAAPRHAAAPITAHHVQMPLCSPGLGGVCGSPLCPSYRDYNNCNGFDPSWEGCQSYPYGWLENDTLYYNGLSVGTLKNYWDNQCNSNWGTVDSWMANGKHWYTWYMSIWSRNCGASGCPQVWSQTYDCCSGNEWIPQNDTHFYTNMAWAPNYQVMVCVELFSPDIYIPSIGDYARVDKCSAWH
ncbi:MAG: hypothetical protein ACHQ4H_14425 [Ktedonobacterales bacterium]